MLSEYRQRFGEFHTKIHRDEYLFRAGRQSRPEKSHFIGEYRDLFSRTALASLRGALEKATPLRETELKSLRQLIAFSLEGSLAAAVSDVSDEIANYEKNERLAWKEDRISIESAMAALAEEADPALRRDLFSRVTDAIKGADALRSDRLERLRSAVKIHGFDDLQTLRKDLRDIDFPQLAEKAAQLLSKTEGPFVSLLSALLPRETLIAFDDASEADLYRLRRFTLHDHFFTPERMMSVYRRLFSDLGFDSTQQSNLEIDAEQRPQKQSRAFCAPIRVPEEIKLCFHPTGGQDNYREFLRESGCAQHFAWTSTNLYPEFRVLVAWGDRASHLAWGMLFENLMVDGHWLMGTFGFLDSGGYLERLACMRLLAIRRHAAMTMYETGVHTSGLENNPGQRFAELMSDAARVRFGDTTHLRELDTPFYSADLLRAFAFESQLREHLKTRFGTRWWASRKAGDMLIDLWNMGQRYSVETMAGLIGFGELDYDWLANEAVPNTSKRVPAKDKR